MINLYPFLFEPDLHKVIWGGNQLKPFKGLEPTDEPIGESWEVSTVPYSTSVISNGVWAGKDLVTVINKEPEAILGKKVNEKYKGNFPLLVKFIDAKRDLSIQVHPNDEMAMREHGKKGKSEMWYVIKADEGAYLYAGFKQEITLDEFQRRVAEGTITEVLAKYKVKAGDVFYIPAGRIHAICGGIMLAEVQQSSNLTYRIFDYNRLGLDGKPRELQTELAARALDYHVDKSDCMGYKDISDNVLQLIASPCFSVMLVDVSSSFHRNMKEYDSFIISMCIEGKCIIRIHETNDDIIFTEGNSILIPAVLADYDVIPIEGKARVLEAFIDNRNI